MKKRNVPDDFRTMRCSGVDKEYKACDHIGTNNRDHCHQCWNLGHRGANYHTGRKDPFYPLIQLNDEDMQELLLHECLTEIQQLRKRIEQLETSPVCSCSEFAKERGNKQ